MRVSLVFVAVMAVSVTASIIPGRRQEKAVCTTPQCVLAAADLLQAMDPTADPCKDFFEFACGGWIKKHPIPDSKSRWTQFDILRDELTAFLRGTLEATGSANDARPLAQAREMYSACMNTDALETVGLKPLTDLLALFGGWPMTSTNWNTNSFDWTVATAAARRLYGSSIFVTVYNYLDSKNTSQSSIYIDQSSLGLPRSTLTGSTPSSSAVFGAYVTFATGAAKAIRDSLGSAATDAQIESDVEAMWRFESELAKITTPPEDRRNNTRMYNPLLLTQIQDWTDSVGATSPQSQIDWSVYLNAIYNEGAGVEVPTNERIIVVETDYLKKLVALLDVTDNRVIANYVHWRLVRSLLDDTTQRMRDLLFDFQKVQLGTSSPSARWLTCTDKVNNLVGYALSGPYVDETFSDDSKTQVETMIGNLKVAFKALVDEASWMDESTKVVAREKADYMSQFVGYPDFVKNKTAVEEYYSGLTTSKDTHFLNIQSANNFLNTKDGQTLRGPTDRTRWNTFPTIVNAFFEPEMNSITFPAGILQNPFFLEGRPWAMNYGSIGVIIGHEITHGFDDQGRQSDKFGNTADWWTEQTVNNYLERAQCFIDQYDNYYPPEFNGTIHVNGINTQGENIADNGGLREAFRAYQNYVAANGEEDLLPGLEQYSPSQIFFISYGNIWCGHETPQRLENLILTDPHSPSYYRVVGPLSNSEDFVRQFGCPAGSPMNRVDKCVIW